MAAALPQRSDKIIVGEIRGPETRGFLDALNTGHRWSLSNLSSGGYKTEKYLPLG
jgi:pilus assembly protein CpaF